MMFHRQRSLRAGRREVSAWPKPIRARLSARIATANIGCGFALLSGTNKTESSLARTKGNNTRLPINISRLRSRGCCSRLSRDLSKQSPLIASIKQRKYWQIRYKDHDDDIAAIYRNSALALRDASFGYPRIGKRWGSLPKWFGIKIESGQITFNIVD